MSASVDYQVLAELRASTAELLRAERRQRAESGGTVLAAEDERELGRSLIAAAVERPRRHELHAGSAALPRAEQDTDLAAAVEAALFGLGRIEPLLADPDVTNIEINGCDRVWLYRRDGRIEPGPPVADSDSELIEWVRTAATYAGLSSRPFDPVHPWLELRLPDGSRLCALMSVVERPTVSIRLFRRERVLLDDLGALGAFDEQLHTFLAAAVGARANLMLRGDLRGEDHAAAGAGERGRFRRADRDRRALPRAGFPVSARSAP